MYFYLPLSITSHITEPYSAHFLSMHALEGKEYYTTSLEGIIRVIKITTINKKQRTLDFSVIRTIKVAKPQETLLYQAILDKPYLDKLVEIIGVIGITHLKLFYSDNSLKHTVNLERLDKILIRSHEQSQQAWKTNLEMISPQDYEKELQNNKPAVLALFEDNYVATGNIRPTHICVGPEGGWSTHEIAQFKHLGLQSISLGNNVFPGWLAGFSYFVKH